MILSSPGQVRIKNELRSKNTICESSIKAILRFLIRVGDIFMVTEVRFFFLGQDEENVRRENFFFFERNILKVEF
jgi:hypothetical protein